MNTRNAGKYRHLYGPVPSRRLGRSLGVDIVPFKVCSYDCVYCQLGRTTDLTATPRSLVSASEVMREIEQWLKSGGTADYITYAGSGEPTLNSDLGEMIRATKMLTSIPSAVITNGSLLSEPDTGAAISMADVLLPSLDAGTEDTFQTVNRPDKTLSFAKMTEGLVRTSKEFPGQVWLEVMLVDGLNDSEAELQAMRDIIQRACPNKLQINTVERPSRSGNVKRVSDQTLTRALDILGETAEVVDSSLPEHIDSQQWREVEEELLQLLSRRPCTAGDIATASGHNIHEVGKYLRRLQNRGVIEQIGDTDPYYRTVAGGQND